MTLTSRLLPLMLLAAAGVSFLRAAELDADKPLTRIALGSCARQDRPQPIWDAIVAYRPDVFLLLGDNIYGDSEDADVLSAKYDLLAAQPGFKKLREKCPILAVWDDHDFGANDAGEEYPGKVQSQRLFNDFFGVPEDSPRRKRPGIYDAVIVGPEGRRVQFILLDTRYFRSPLKAVPRDERKDRGPYGADEDPAKTMLGEAQWKWLGEQLRVPAELRIIGSSVQVVPEEHGWEKWGNFPRERQRLFDLIAESKASGVIMVSGDRHLAEISAAMPERADVPYPLYDMTSSSLNQPSGGGNEAEPNRHRVGESYLKVNFGTITIDWNDAPTVRLAIHDLEGEVVRETTLRLSELAQ